MWNGSPLMHNAWASVKVAWMGAVGWDCSTVVLVQPVEASLVLFYFVSAGTEVFTMASLPTCLMPRVGCWNS